LWWETAFTEKEVIRVLQCECVFQYFLIGHLSL
jgi:hypothetical protein